MYQVLIAEDSKLILRDLRRILESSGHDAVIHEAHDGQDALKLLEICKPDIIFTDIRMHVMNGLTLIQKAKEKYPQVKTVIISGYSDFEYTHEALRLQVDDYIMKPVDEDQLLRVYDSLLKQIDLLKKQGEEIMLQVMLQEASGPAASFLPAKFMMTIIRTGILQEYAFPLSRKEIADHLLLPTAQSSAWIVNARVNNEKVVLYDLTILTRSQAAHINEDLMKGLSGRFERVNLICSDILTDPSGLHPMYEQMHAQLKRELLLDRSSILYYDGSGQQADRYIRQLEENTAFQKRIGQILKSRHYTDFEKAVRAEIEKWKNEKYPVYQIRKCMLVIIDELLITVGKDNLLPEDPGTVVDRTLHQSSSFKELEQQLLDYSESLLQIREDHLVVSSDLIRHINAFLRNHIYDNVSLKDIANQFEISPSYLCRIFKIYYNDTPISYYNLMKIQEAKRIMEEYYHMKIKDVAELLGFSDQYYFSKVFKQQYGVSPSVFRAQLTEFSE